MPDQQPIRFRVEENEQSVARFEATYAGDQVYRDRPATITLSVGLKDSDDVAHLVPRVESREPDSYTLRRVKGGPGQERVETVVQGFDGGRDLQRPIRKRYLRPRPPLEAGQPMPTSIPTRIPMDEAIGNWTARIVAEDIAALCDKSCLWDVPDYPLVDDFIAGNRGLDALNELASPFQQVEPFRAKVRVEGNTVVVRQRRPQPVQADIALTVAELVPTTLEVVARRPQRIGLIIVTGKAKPPIPDDSGDGPMPPTPGGTRTFRIDAGDELTYREPDHLLISAKLYSRSEGAGAGIALRTEIEKDWPSSHYGPDGRPTFSPAFPRAETTTKFGIPAGATDKVVRTVEQSTIEYAADFQGFLDIKRETKSRWEAQSVSASGATIPAGLKPFEQIITRYIGSGPILADIVLERYRLDETFVFSHQFGASGVGAGATLLDTQHSPAGGHRPGGPGRAGGMSLPRRSTDGQDAGVEEVVLDLGDPLGRVFEYHNRNLPRALCQQIADQAALWAVWWEYDAFLTAPAIPWLQQDQAFAVRDFKGKDGDAVTAGPGEAYELEFEHDESAPGQKHSTGTLRWVWWGA